MGAEPRFPLRAAGSRQRTAAARRRQVRRTTTGPPALEFSRRRPSWFRDEYHLCFGLQGSVAIVFRTASWFPLKYVASLCGRLAGWSWILTGMPALSRQWIWIPVGFGFGGGAWALIDRAQQRNCFSLMA